MSPDYVSPDGRIKLYNADCMDYMATLEPNAFDLAVVDPPYGLGEAGERIMTRGSKRGATRFWGTKNTRGTAIESTIFTPKQWDSEPPERKYFERLMRVSKNQIIWGANHFIDRLPPKFVASPCWVVWDKENGDSNFADCELAWGSFRTAVRIFRFRWSGMLQGDMKNKEQRIHPTQKPAKLYKWTYTKYAKLGARILGTHLGSGSSAIAAHYAGLDFVGIELDKDYFDAAVARFEKETAQQDMFGKGAA